MTVAEKIRYTIAQLRLPSPADLPRRPDDTGQAGPASRPQARGALSFSASSGASSLE